MQFAYHLDLKTTIRLDETGLKSRCNETLSVELSYNLISDTRDVYMT